ncbi:hypothetical protein, partial [Bacteroides uniformis]|uniref:hypothetical protein n=1 Tax=Bacteroides uniformis TaxID=820 RepID=UPI001C7011BF
FSTRGQNRLVLGGSLHWIFQFPIKEDYTTGKAERLHSEKSKQTIEADCRFGSEISNYLSTALKG